MIPTTYLSLHDVSVLRASAQRIFDTPLVLNIDSPHGSMQISMYLRGVGAERIQALADAINDALKQPEPPQAACSVEKAAYASADDYYACLQRDLNRRPIGHDDLGKLQAGEPSLVDGKR